MCPFGCFDGRPLAEITDEDIDLDLHDDLEDDEQFLRLLFEERKRRNVLQRFEKVTRLQRWWKSMMLARKARCDLASEAARRERVDREEHQWAHFQEGVGKVLLLPGHAAIRCPATSEPFAASSSVFKSLLRRQRERLLASDVPRGSRAGGLSLRSPG